MSEQYFWWNTQKFFTSAQIRKIQKQMKKSYKKAGKIQKVAEKKHKKEEQEAENLLKDLDLLD